MYFRKLYFSLFLVLCPLPVWGQAESENIQEKIQAVLSPYRQDPPQVEGITAGMKIDKTNVQIAAGGLPTEILKILMAGDFFITVQEANGMSLRPGQYEAA